MHCESCEVLIERKIKAISGVERVSVNHKKQRAVVTGNRAIRHEEIDSAISGDGYRVSNAENAPEKKRRLREYGKTGAIFLVIFSAYLIARQLNIVPDLGVSSDMSYAMIFALGLVAALSTCMAVTGGLLLALSARYAETHKTASVFAKFAPHIAFNTGRVLSYTIFGAALGAAGSLFTFSPKATGLLILVASAAMIILGLKLLKLMPAIQLSLPGKRLAHALQEFADHHPRVAPFFLGASTFFLPCGFTQALQLYILTTGSPARGAFTMIAFSLGTLPALLSLGAISSFAKGVFQNYLLRGAGALVIILGIANIGNGLLLMGARIGFSPKASAYYEDPNVVIENGKQIVSMKVKGLEYIPHRFTVKQGMPVVWKIDGRGAQGCAQVIMAPKINLLEYLPKDGVKTITFTPETVGEIAFSCTMGMTTPNSAFIVEANAQTISKIAPDSSKSKPDELALSGFCDPSLMDCETQRLSMEISRERGFYPNRFTVKKDVPIELVIDATVELSGCMSTLVVPEYNIAHFLNLGKSVLRFTPTRLGVIPFTCSMGSKMGEFIVR